MPTPTDQLAGQLLLAAPTLQDESFKKSVIFLAEHSPEGGAYGLVINRPSHQTIGATLPGQACGPLSENPVHIGGPVDQQHLTFAAMHKDQHNRISLITRLSAEQAIEQHNQANTRVHAFAGYAAWTAGQLENELRLDSWTTIHPDSLLFTAKFDRSLWATLMRSVSPYHRILAETPDEIFSN